MKEIQAGWDIHFSGSRSKSSQKAGRFDSRQGQSYTHRSPDRKDHAH